MYPLSPNTVLANALTCAEDVLRPRIEATAPERVVFVVGTQINGAPHVGTSLTQSLAFAAAARVRDRFGLPVEVKFGALDNAPYETIEDPATGHRYQRAYAHALGEHIITNQIGLLHRPLLVELSARLDVRYSVETYTQQQASGPFRRTWLRLLPRADAARYWLAPSTGVPHVRVPCPRAGCGWAEKYAQRTRVEMHRGAEHATVRAVCLHHGEYAVTIGEDSGGYLDLATLYRNLVKELLCLEDHGTLYVMVKGGDWVFGSQLVDGAAQAVGLTPGQLPARLFCPQIVTDTGAKLSKSLIREGHSPLPPGAAAWMLDTRDWPGSVAGYAERLLAFVDVLFTDPRHFYRSYSAAEIGRMIPAPTTPTVRSLTAP